MSEKVLMPNENREIPKTPSIGYWLCWAKVLRPDSK